MVFIEMESWFHEDDFSQVGTTIFPHAIGDGAFDLKKSNQPCSI